MRLYSKPASSYAPIFEQLKTSRNPIALESKKGGALIGGGAPNGEFTVYLLTSKKRDLSGRAYPYTFSMGVPPPLGLIYLT